MFDLKESVMVELKEITTDNFEEVMALKVSDEQKSFVSTVAYSLAQAWVYKTAFPFAVYADNKPVGFIMMGYYTERKQYTLWKFLIDERYQNKGYGRKALLSAIEYMAEEHRAREIYTGVALGNSAAKHLYSSVGFEETGVIENGMEEMKYIFRGFSPPRPAEI